MLEDSDRLLSTIEQILRTGRMGASSRTPNLSRVDLDDVVARVRRPRPHVSPPRPRTLSYRRSAAGASPSSPMPDEVRAAISNLIDNADQVLRQGGPRVRSRCDSDDEQRRGARDTTRGPAFRSRS